MVIQRFLNIKLILKMAVFLEITFVNFVPVRNFLPQTCRTLQPLGIPTPFIWIGQSVSFMVPLFHSFPKATVASPRRFIGPRELVTVSLFAISELSVRVMWYSGTQRGSGCPANGELYITALPETGNGTDRQTDKPAVWKQVEFL
jgi:hypothetical protein